MRANRRSTDTDSPLYKLLHRRGPKHRSPHHALKQACSIQCMSDEAKNLRCLLVYRHSKEEGMPQRKYLISGQRGSLGRLRTGGESYSFLTTQLARIIHNSSLQNCPTRRETGTSGHEVLVHSLCPSLRTYHVTSWLPHLYQPGRVWSSEDGSRRKEQALTGCGMPLCECVLQSQTESRVL